jgi:hypothetical protein
MPSGYNQYAKLKIYYAVLLALTLLFTLYEELHLRRWLFHRFGRDSVVAGSLPNFLAVLVFSVAFTVIKPSEREGGIIRTVIAIVLGLVIYEIAQIWMPHRTFDWNDIAATLLGGIFSWVVLALPRQLLLLSGKPARI